MDKVLAQKVCCWQPIPRSYIKKGQFITGAVRKDLQGVLSAQSLFWDAEISCQDHMMISRGHYY
jgi:hypothetical protein